MVGISSSPTNEKVQIVLVGNAKICDVGIELADAQLSGTGEPLVDRVHGIVLPPKHQVGVINVLPDAKLPPILADALADADAILLAVVVDIHGPAVGTGDGGH